MKFTKSKCLTALLAVMGLCAIVMGAVLIYHSPASHALAFKILGTFAVLAGTASVVQTFPIAGTFPTSAQAVSCNTQINRCVFADGDTTLALTHNWGLTATQLAQFLPLITWYIQNPGVTAPVVSFALTDSNTVTMAKVGTTGSGGTFVVTLQRPQSMTL